MRDLLFAWPEELSSRAISKAYQEKRPAGATPPTFFATAGSRVRLRCDSLPECQSKRRAGCCALGGQHRLNRYHRGTADSIVRRYGANVRREVRITEFGYSQLYTDLLITKCREMRDSVKFFLGDHCGLHRTLSSRNDPICGIPVTLSRHSTSNPSSD